MSYHKFPIKNCYIIGAKRTPIGTFSGLLSKYHGPILAAIATKSLLDSLNLKPEIVQEVILGCALSSGLRQGPARQAALRVGMPFKTSCTKISCGMASGIRSIEKAAQSIMLGQRSIVLAGGFQSMSLTPHLLMRHHVGEALNPSAKLHDGLVMDYFNNWQSGLPLGKYAEDISVRIGLSKQVQDDYAAVSFQRALNPSLQSFYATNVCPVKIHHEQTLQTDETLNNFSKQALQRAPPIFSSSGTITVANSSRMADGACTLLLASQQSIQKYRLKALARIQGFWTVGSSSATEMSESPARAVLQLLRRHGLKTCDIDAFEIDQCYSCIALATMHYLQLDIEKINPLGGSIALGNPLGATGSRMLQHLLYQLKNQNHRRAVAVVGDGYGGATAVLLTKC